MDGHSIGRRGEQRKAIVPSASRRTPDGQREKSTTVRMQGGRLTAQTECDADEKMNLYSNFEESALIKGVRGTKGV